MGEVCVDTYMPYNIVHVTYSVFYFCVHVLGLLKAFYILSFFGIPGIQNLKCLGGTHVLISLLNNYKCIWDPQIDLWLVPLDPDD